MSGRPGLVAHLPWLGLALVACVYFVASFSYTPESRAMPRAVAVLALLLIAIHAAMPGRSRAARTPDHAPASGEPPTKSPEAGTRAAAAHSISDEAAAFVWIAALLALVVAAGFYVAIPVFVFSYLRIHAAKSMLSAAVFAIVLTGLLFLLFDLMMGYELYRGLISGDFM